MPLEDRFARRLRNLRVSVTDRCNLRCAYCMPEDDYVWLPRNDLLSFEELGRLVDVFVGLGVDALRLTGGEPLLRRDLSVLVRKLAARGGLRDIAMTTNAVLLADQAEALAAAGLQRVTVSLDTLKPERYRELTRRHDLQRAIAGLEAAIAAGIAAPKINCVVMRGINDDELVDMLGFAREIGAELRFIEYMDVGGATQWSHSLVVPRDAILAALEASLGPIVAEPRDGPAPADRYVLGDGTRFGIIASTTQPFCSACNRARLTADGRFFLCLYARSGLDLRGPLRAGASDDDLADLLRASWTRRDDRGAETRLADRARGALAGPDVLRDDPHLEMHTRGG